MCHYIMTEPGFELPGTLIIDIVDMVAHLPKLFVGNVEAEFPLAFGERDPEFAPC